MNQSCTSTGNASAGNASANSTVPTCTNVTECVLACEYTHEVAPVQEACAASEGPVCAAANTASTGTVQWSPHGMPSSDSTYGTWCMLRGSYLGVGT